ncbi:MAG TPA: hypothetical protein VHY31_03440 [Streptosporangiaceae bacterium]|nr:hypothetical protein [Streptosporangiaceae bacterium]
MSPNVTDLPDLASRPLGGSVVFATNDLFAPRENLISPGAPEFDPAAFGLRGKIYDGWETRRHRAPDHDHAPERVRLLAADARTGPPEAAWREVLPPTRVQPDTRHRFAIDDGDVTTHVRLDVLPDGGLARLRISGEIIDEALAQLRQRWQDALP